MTEIGFIRVKSIILMVNKLILNNVREKFQSCSQNKSLEWMKFEIVVYKNCVRELHPK
jgi:hypothetical protein